MKTLYLNNSGYRWINVDSKGKHDKIKTLIGGIEKDRSVKYWEALGNFAVPYISLKGKTRMLHYNHTNDMWTVYEELPQFQRL